MEEVLSWVENKTDPKTLTPTFRGLHKLRNFGTLKDYERWDKYSA